MPFTPFGKAPGNIDHPTRTIIARQSTTENKSARNEAFKTRTRPSHTDSANQDSQKLLARSAKIAAQSAKPQKGRLFGFKKLRRSALP
jgi:hypothetical protein